MDNNKILDMNYLFELLKIHNITLSTAESLTGGMIAAKITKIPGISEFFRGGVIVYSNEMKTRLLDVPEAHLKRFGPYNSGTTDRMASGVCKLMGTNSSIAVSGVAGPGDDQGVEAGTVYISVKVKNLTVSTDCHFKGSREEVRAQTVYAALDLLQDALSGEDPFEKH